MGPNNKRKMRAARLSIASNTLLIIIKIIAGIASGSVSILSEAAHSGADLLAAVIAAASVKISAKPADKNHPYGHGKVENVSGVIEGLLIFCAAAFIIVESVEKLMYPGPFEVTALPVIVMVVSAAVNYLVSGYLYKVAKEEDSIALEADALHLKTDVYTSAGVALGLILISFTGVKILDPIIAIAVALLIIKEAWHLCSSAFSPLLDSSLPEDEEAAIQKILEEHGSGDFQFCHLRTRKSGPNRFIDFHAKVKPNIPVSKADEMSKHLQQEIEQLVPNAHIHVNIEAQDK
jgi:cation diffusion facilitator family transporter